MDVALQLEMGREYRGDAGAGAGAGTGTDADAVLVRFEKGKKYLYIISF